MAPSSSSETETSCTRSAGSDKSQEERSRVGILPNLVNAKGIGSRLGDFHCSQARSFIALRFIQDDKRDTWI
jgi:hypothetical protein